MIEMIEIRQALTSKNGEEHVMHTLLRMRQRRNFLLKAFLINYILIFIAWLICFIPGIDGLVNSLMGTEGMDTKIALFNMLGIWKIGGVLLFLVPALAAWWEMHSCKKHIRDME